MERPLASSELQQRVLSAIVLILIALCGVLGGQQWAVLVVAVLGILAMYEWLEMLRPPQVNRLQALGYGAVALALLASYWASPFFGVLLMVLMTGGMFFFALGAIKVAAAAGTTTPRPMQVRAAWVAAGVPYIVGGTLAILVLRQWPISGLGLTCYLLLAVCGTDIGAYFIGRWLRGPKLLPAVSPSKTWSGLLGGVATASLLGYACALGFHARMPLLALGLAAVLAVIAQAGDLFESYVKRRCGVKDSGRIIPGHGGVLDRIDGLLSAALFLALFQAQVGEKLLWW